MDNSNPHIGNGVFETTVTSQPDVKVSTFNPDALATELESIAAAVRDRHYDSLAMSIAFSNGDQTASICKIVGNDTGYGMHTACAEFIDCATADAFVESVSQELPTIAVCDDGAFIYTGDARDPFRVIANLMVDTQT